MAAVIDLTEENSIIDLTGEVSDDDNDDHVERAGEKMIHRRKHGLEAANEPTPALHLSRQ